MRTHCQVCGGKGRITNPECYGQFMAYCGPNGERAPTIVCPNCQGERFVGTPDVRHPLIPNDLTPESR